MWTEHLSYFNKSLVILIIPYTENSLCHTLNIHSAIPIHWAFIMIYFHKLHFHEVFTHAYMCSENSESMLERRLYAELITTAVTPVLSYVQLERYCIQTLLKSYWLSETLILWNETTVNRRTCHSDALFCAIVVVIKNWIWLLS